MTAAAPTLLDVTDLVEFLQRRESVSGVQRVIAETAPLLLVDRENPVHPVVLDRPSGRFVALTEDETTALIATGASIANAAPDRDALAAMASACLARARTATAVEITTGTVLVFLGAVWINDALMLAARHAHIEGARLVFLLYDLTPVLQTGHTPAVTRLFERYLTLVMETASAVPAISQASRRDFVEYCERAGVAAPPGQATGLPCGITPQQFPVAAKAEARPWPRPYALFVGTVEARKHHILALRAWQRLIERHGTAHVPDLVCVGRLGWHADEFLTEYTRTNGLDGKVTVLSTSVPDAELARFYAHADFTVYSSRYEGWGLPVSESLAFGKVAIAARNSSIPEAGGDLASYFATDEVDDMVRVIEQDGLDTARRAELEARIRIEFHDLTWQHVANVISHDIAHARSTEARTPVFPAIELGHEYVLSAGEPAPDSGYADQMMRHLQTSARSPMLGQVRDSADAVVVDSALVGAFGSPQAWGLELRPGRRVDLRVTRPVSGPLVALISTRSMPGRALVDISGPGGPAQQEVYLGSVITLPLGDGAASELAQVSMTVLDATDSIEGFLGIRSFVVLRADDLQAQVIAHKAAADALRQELDFMQGTRSWKVTAPLRKMKGRGAG